MGSKQPTVEDASPSPPLQDLPIASASTTPAVVDQPITSLGDDDSDSEGDVEGVWDPAEEKLPGESRKGKRKADVGDATDDGAHPWQAVWSAEKNGDVTWTNPLEPTSDLDAAPPLPPGPAPTAQPNQYGGHVGGAPEIDPGLAFLLPPEARGGPSDPDSQSAMFNARTGRFTGGHNYSADRLDEFNRMKRMSSQYFDYEKWEKEVAKDKEKRKREEEAGTAQKAISKKDMERFKKKKQEKRLRGQAWLRD